MQSDIHSYLSTPTKCLVLDALDECSSGLDELLHVATNNSWRCLLTRVDLTRAVKLVMKIGYKERFPGISHEIEDRAMHEALTQLRPAPAS